LASRRSPSQRVQSLSADSHTPCRSVVCFRGRFIVRRPYHVRVLLKLPSAQSPFARARCYLARRDLGDHVSGCCPAFIAPTGSCASPPPSLCLGGTLNTRSVQVAVSPCWEKDLPDVISAYLSLRAWTPTPAARGVHLPVSSSTTSAFPSFGPGRRSAKPVQRFQYGALFEAAVISPCSGPQVCSPPRSLLPIRPAPYGSRDFSIRASRGLLPPRAPDMLAVRIGQLTAEDFHLVRYAALSAAPRTLALTCCRKPKRGTSRGWRQSGAVLG